MHRAFLTAMMVVVVLHIAAASRIEIPCNTNQSVVFTVQSNRDYTLTNCEPPAGTDSGVSIAPDATAVVNGVLVVQNISLTVVGGSVLPLIAMPITLASNSCNVENVIISIGGARIGPYHYHYTGVRSLVSIFYVLHQLGDTQHHTRTLRHHSRYSINRCSCWDNTDRGVANARRF